MIEMKFTEEQLNRLGEILNGLFGNADELLTLVQGVADHNTTLRQTLEAAQQNKINPQHDLVFAKSFHLHLTLNEKQLAALQPAFQAGKQANAQGRAGAVFGQIFGPGDKDFLNKPDEIYITGDFFDAPYNDHIAQIIHQWINKKYN